MTADDFFVWLRVYVIVLSVLVAVVGTCQWRRWPTFMVENQYAWLAIAALNLSAFIGCLESLVEHVPGGWRTYVLALAETWLLVAVLHHPLSSWRVRRRETKEN